MKIAFFLDASSGLGGAGNLLLQQAILMSKLHDVIVVIPVNNKKNYNVEYAKRCEWNSIKYVCLPFDTATSFSGIDFTGAMNNAKYIEEFAVNEGIKFFHSVQLNLSVEYISRKLKIPHLMDIYQLQDEEFILCPGDIYPHYHLCDSNLYSNKWSYELNIESRCIRPVALLDKIKRKLYDQTKIKILMLGRVCVRKNQMAAIKAVENCSSNFKIELHIVGDFDDDYGDECKQYVLKNNLDKVIFFHGFISDVVPMLVGNDCLLYSSIDESFPSSIVEALSYDLTIISTPVAGVPELFVDKYNSFISDDFSFQCISKSISECVIYYMNGKIKNIHKNAEKLWLENFDRKMIRENIEKYYLDILNSKKSYNISCFEEIKKLVIRVEQLIDDIDDSGEEWIRKRSVYYLMVQKYLCKGKIYIWGAGKRGELSFELLKRICPETQIVAFIDTNKSGMFCGLPIIRVENVSVNKNDFYCVSFAIGSELAVRYLKSQGAYLYRQVWPMP